MAWHNGLWWPLYTSAWYNPKVSQYMFDPYSLTHILHGLIFQLIFISIIHSSIAGFLTLMLIELGWEVLENGDFIMEKFRSNSGTSGQYKGDSVQNILGDMLSCAAGYALATVFHLAGVWWASLVWIVVSEVVCVLYMRASLAIMMFALIFKNEALIAWQAEGIPKEELEVVEAKEK